MKSSLVKKIKTWELGKRIVFVPHKHKIKGEIVVSKKGNIYHNYYKRKKIGGFYNGEH